MITLAIDTSTTHGSVALLADGELLLDETLHRRPQPQRHAFRRAGKGARARTAHRSNRRRPRARFVSPACASPSPRRSDSNSALGAQTGRHSVGRRAGDVRAGLPRHRRRAAGDVLFHARRATACASKARCSRRKPNFANACARIAATAGPRHGAELPQFPAAQIALPSAAHSRASRGRGPRHHRDAATSNRSISASRTSRSRKRGRVFHLAREAQIARRSSRSADCESAADSAVEPAPRPPTTTTGPPQSSGAT